MEESIKKISTSELVDLFNYSKGLEIIPWQESTEAVGFSLIKEYPNKGLFIPARNKNGVKDSVAMIRIWYMKGDLQLIKKQTKVPLSIAVIKSSRYTFDHPFNNFEDPNSPTKVSLAVSNSSKQPVDLEDTSRYELNVDKKKIFDLKANIYVKPKTIIEEAYKLHLNLITDIPFQISSAIRHGIVSSVDPVNSFCKKINLYWFGKDIKVSKDFGVGLITPYSYKDLEDIPETREKANILGSNFPISPRSAETFIGLFFAIYIVNYLFQSDFTGMIKLMNSTSNNFFLAILTAGMLLIYDRLIPYSILFVINSLIKLKWYLLMSKIKV